MSPLFTTFLALGLVGAQAEVASNNTNGAAGTTIIHHCGNFNMVAVVTYETFCIFYDEAHVCSRLLQTPKFFFLLTNCILVSTQICEWPRVDYKLLKEVYCPHWHLEPAPPTPPEPNSSSNAWKGALAFALILVLVAFLCYLFREEIRERGVQVVHYFRHRNNNSGIEDVGEGGEEPLVARLRRGASTALAMVLLGARGLWDAMQDAASKVRDRACHRRSEPRASDLDIEAEEERNPFVGGRSRLRLHPEEADGSERMEMRPTQHTTKADVHYHPNLSPPSLKVGNSTFFSVELNA